MLIRVPTQHIKAPLCIAPPVIPPHLVWIPLSKGTHREPHGRLIPPAKYQYTNEIYDIGTEILYQTCFGHNSTQKASPEELQVRIFTKFSVDSESAIKIRFSKIGIFAQKAPAGILREPFYKYSKEKNLAGIFNDPLH